MGGMTDDVRRVLHTAGMAESRRVDQRGFRAAPGSQHGIVRLQHVGPGMSLTQANGQVSQYVRVLQAAGYRVDRVDEVTSPDRLIVLERPR